MKVLGIGESVIDTYVIQGEETKNEAPPDGPHVGGPVLAALILLARMGVRCEFMTGLGQDDEADIIARTLRSEGVAVHANAQTNSKINTIVVDTATGRRTKLRSTVRHTPLSGLDAAHISTFDLIIVDRHEREAFYEVLRKKKPSAKVVIDPSTEVSDFTRDMIQQAECPIVPIESLYVLEDKPDIFSTVAALHRKCDNPLVVTLGELGSLAYDGRHLEFVPSLQLDAVDANGAGDIFRGAFAYGLLKKWNHRRCARFANIAAGLQCTRLGNVAAIPTKAEIDAHTRAARKRLDLHHVNEYFQQLRNEYAT